MQSKHRDLSRRIKLKFEGLVLIEGNYENKFPNSKEKKFELFFDF